MSNFFVLEHDLRDPYSTDYLKEDPVNLGTAPTCGNCGAYIALRPWLPPYRARVTAPNEDFGDVAFGSGTSLLISDRAVEAFRAAQLTGLSSPEPVQTTALAKARGSTPAPTYWHVTVDRPYAASVDESRSHLVRDSAPECEVCRTSNLTEVHGFEIDDSTWHGEDVFVARGIPGVLVVSERFKHTAEGAQLTNMNLVPTASFERPRGPATAVLVSASDTE